MIITCPKCKICYEVDNNLVGSDEKKVHCSGCGEIWSVSVQEKPLVVPSEKDKISEEKVSVAEKPKEDKKTEEQDIVKSFIKDKEPIIDPMVFHGEIKRNRKEPQDNIDEIFSSFSIRRGRDIDAYTPEPLKKNCSIFLNIMMSLISLIIIGAFCLYYLRFEIAANYPQSRELYDRLGIEATYLGQGLIFEEVTKLEYDDGFYPQMIVTGFITNNSLALAEVPIISVKFLTADNEFIEEIQYNTGVDSLEAGDKIQFDVSLDKPDVLVKYVEITFIK